MTDIEVHLHKKKNMFLTPKPQARKHGISLGTDKNGSPVVNTVFSFVDREASKSQANATGNFPNGSEDLIRYFVDKYLTKELESKLLY